MQKKNLGILGSLLLLVVALSLPAAAQFATIQQGPLSGACQSAPALGIDQVTNVDYSCGNSHIWSANSQALTVLPAQTAVTTVTTAQTMGSLALAAGMQNVVGRHIIVCGSGVYTSPGTTAPTITISLLEGGVTPISITSSAVSTTASTNLPFSFCFNVTTAATGSSGTVESHGYLNINLSANTPAAAITSFLDTNTALSSAINLTAANTLAIQVSASLTITSVTLRQATIFLLS